MFRNKWLTLLVLIPATVLVVFGIYWTGIRPWHLSWGMTETELRMPQPGDEFTPANPQLNTNHAITIDALPEVIWPWLVQTGARRGGWYSYELIENMVGCGIHNADRIIPEFQRLNLGDQISICVYGPNMTVMVFEPNRALMLKGWGTWVLQPLDDHSTKLIIRSRGNMEPGIQNSVLNFLVWRMLLEPIYFIMERKMLVGLKERVEGTLSSPVYDEIQVVLWLVLLGIFVVSGIGVFFRRIWGRPYLVALGTVIVATFLLFAQPSISIGIPLTSILLLG